VHSLFPEAIIVSNKSQLLNLDLLIIGDDHYDRHKELLQSPGFIDCINTLNLPVMVMTTEKIFGSYFPWNEENYRILRTINNLYHHTADIDDCIRLKTSLHRITISNKYKDIYRTDKKKNELIFVGSTHCTQGSYERRRLLLIKLEELLPVTVIDKEIPKWEDYMRKIAEYRFVLCPLGNSNFFPTRIWEVLAVGSIPVQQITPEMMEWYDVESKFDDCIYFQELKEAKDKMDACTIKTSHNEYWAEDNLIKLLTEDGLYGPLLS
jgi:hypothetical protein